MTDVGMVVNAATELSLDETLKSLESEVVSTPSPTTTEIPDKFKGKSLEDIIKAYQNLESEHGRKAQELGELRKLTDHILNQPVQPQQPAPAPTIDQELEELENLDPATRKAVEALVTKYVSPLAHELKASKKEETLNKLIKAHPDMEQIMTDPTFQSWVTESKVRLSLYQTADTTYDFDAANELLNMWKERQLAQKVIAETQQQGREQALRAGTTETGASVTEAGSKKIYRRVDLIRLKQTNPARYSELQPEIMKAYAEGRVK